MTSDSEVIKQIRGSDLDIAGDLSARSIDSPVADGMSKLSGDALMREVLGLEDPKDRTRQTRREPKKLMYFRLCDGETCSVHPQGEGWVTMGPASGVITAQEHAEFSEAKHATPLTAYGRHDLDAVANPSTRYGPLISEGGIKELPIGQMRAFGWHRIPAVVALVPELADTVEYYCENGCPKAGKRGRWFLSEDILKKHTEALHRDAAAPAAVGRHIVQALKDVSEYQAMDTERLVATVILGIKAYEDSKTQVGEPDIDSEEVETESEETEDEAQSALNKLNDLTSSKEGD